VIQLTSGVTIKILGTVRNALLVLFTVFGQGASGESVSDMQFLGYFVTLLGFTAYNYFKMQKSSK
jgi:hypothetical protein